MKYDPNAKKKQKRKSFDSKDDETNFNRNKRDSFSEEFSKKENSKQQTRIYNNNAQIMENIYEEENKIYNDNMNNNNKTNFLMKEELKYKDQNKISNIINDSNQNNNLIKGNTNINNRNLTDSNTSNKNMANVNLKYDPMTNQIKDLNVNVNMDAETAYKLYQENKQYLPSQQQVISGAKITGNMVQNSGILNEIGNKINNTNSTAPSQQPKKKAGGDPLSNNLASFFGSGVDKSSNLGSKGNNTKKGI